MSTIEWTDKTWNPTLGCSRCSPGCDSCYAITQAAREMQPAHAGLTVRDAAGGLDWTGEVRLHPERLVIPLRWRKDYMVFVDSMSDLFEVSVPDHFIDEVFAVMIATKRNYRDHAFQVLTKRAQRMAGYLKAPERRQRIIDAANRLAADDRLGDRMAGVAEWLRYGPQWWPLPNLWLGVSAENQRYLDLRVPYLLDSPAAVRFVSVEPMIGPIDLRGRPNDRRHHCIVCGLPRDELHHVGHTFRDKGIDWVIVGGESGRNARPMHPEWARSIRDQCARSGVPLLFKQWGQWGPADRAEATHLVNEHRPEPPVPIADVLMPSPYEGGAPQDFIDRGHAGWARMRKHSGKKYAGRELDGRTHDEYPAKVDLAWR